MSTCPVIDVINAVPKSIADLICPTLTHVLSSSQIWIDFYNGEHGLYFALMASWYVLIF